MRNATMTDSLYRWSNTILVCDRQAQTVDFFFPRHSIYRSLSSRRGAIHIPPWGYCCYNTLAH